MILDTSCLIAIFFGEPEQAIFSQMILSERRCLISAANFLELCIVVDRRLGTGAWELIELFFEKAEIKIEIVTVSQTFLAREAYSNFGKGRHPAGLNFGDCFAYALAKSLGEPLLFKGNDFSQTDLIAAT